jgi:hypothetical protein
MMMFARFLFHVNRVPFPLIAARGMGERKDNRGRRVAGIEVSERFLQSALPQSLAVAQVMPFGPFLIPGGLPGGNGPPFSNKSQGENPLELPPSQRREFQPKNDLP